MSAFLWNPDAPPDARALANTASMNTQDADIQRVLSSIVRPNQSDKDKAIALFNYVRDEIRYDPYRVGLEPSLFSAGDPIRAGRAYCVPKAITWVTLLRACGIPALLGFADVTNHMSSAKLQENLRSDIFAHHGYGVVWLEGKWLKATPTFNRTLCEKAQIQVLEFDGESDAIFHPFDLTGHRHMEYLTDHGWRWDFDLAELDQAYRLHYPHWYQPETAIAGANLGDFEQEVADESASSSSASRV